MVTCNVHCDIALQCGNGHVQKTVFTLQYALLERITGDLQLTL